MNRLLTFLLLFLLPVLASAQLVLFEGRVVDSETGQAIAGVQVVTSLDQTFTEQDGSFVMELSMDVREIDFSFVLNGYQTLRLTATVTEGMSEDLGTIEMARILKSNELLAREDQIPTVVIAEDDLDGAVSSSQDISGLLTASRDVFVSSAAFALGPLRFRIRGLDSENTQVFLNGVSVNSLENGRVFWSAWGGLNDVLRFRENHIGLEATDYALGGIGGSTILDTRASLQRRQLSVSYAASNRAYRNRIMATWSSGLLENGWAFSFSGSRRWADQGFIPGTFYDAWSYYVSIDKHLNDKHRFNLTALGAPIKRGRSSASVQELYDLAGTNFYNPFWGYQNGEVRNSRVGNTHQPIAILRHDWTISSRATLTTAVSYQFGRNGSTALEWFDARDPRPEYYRYLPSAIDEENRDFMIDYYENNPDALQIDWDYMYNVNYESEETIENVNGIEGNDVTGRRAKYVVEDRRFDSKVFNVNTIYNHILNDQFSIQGGAGYQLYRGDNFKELVDLLGGEFYVDIDRFATFDFPNDVDAQQNDLNRPNRLITEGDRYGYDYSSTIHKGYVWGQGQLSTRRIEAFLGGELSQTRFWRTGNVQNGRFPDSSLGDSEKQEFLNYSIKTGLTYKLDSRNFLYVYGAALTRAPFFRNAFVSPRTRNQVVDGLTNEQIESVEGGYILRSPYLKARATGYYANFRNGVRTLSFFNDENVQTETSDDATTFGLVNFALTGIDKRHIGTEIAIEWKAFAGLSVSGVAALGQYIYTSRPSASIISENIADLQVTDRVVYQKNFYVPGTPQTSYSFGLNYQGKKYWFANLNLNYVNNNWMDFNPNRRTEQAVFDLEPGTPEWNNILDQEMGQGGFTLDFFGGKSFRYRGNFLFINLGVSNILNNTNIVTGGFEQLRFDFEGQNPDRFPTRYYYGFGRTFFLNLSLRI